MAKSKIKVLIDIPVIVFFTIVCAVVFFLQTKFPSLKFDTIFTSPTTAAGKYPFAFSNLQSVLRLFLFEFGFRSVSAFLPVALCFALSADSETTYGSGFFFLMAVISTVVTGVLLSVTCSNTFCGFENIAFLSVFLSFFTNLRRKQLPLSLIFITLFFVLSEFLPSNNPGLIPFLVSAAGGLCGSLISFFVAPKKTSGKVNKSKSLLKRAEKLAEYDDSNSPRHQNSSDDTTVIGSIDF